MAADISFWPEAGEEKRFQGEKSSSDSLFEEKIKIFCAQQSLSQSVTLNPKSVQC